MADKKKPECLVWGIKWALVAIVILILFFLTKLGVEITSDSGILEFFLLVFLILLTILASPLKIILSLLPGDPEVIILSCKITGCNTSMIGLFSIVLLWFALGILVGLLIVRIKSKMNEPAYLKEFKVK